MQTYRVFKGDWVTSQLKLILATVASALTLLARNFVKRKVENSASTKLADLLALPCPIAEISCVPLQLITVHPHELSTLDAQLLITSRGT